MLRCDNSTAIMDITLITEAGEITKIYFVTYNTPVIDLILEYISPRPLYCPRAKALVQYQGLGSIYSSTQSITG